MGYLTCMVYLTWRWLKMECAYQDHSAVAEGFQCPDCSGPLAYRVRNYWRGAARERLGPDMALCETHGAWYNKSGLGGSVVEHAPARGR